MRFHWPLKANNCVIYYACVFNHPVKCVRLPQGKNNYFRPCKTNQVYALYSLDFFVCDKNVGYI